MLHRLALTLTGMLVIVVLAGCGGAPRLDVGAVQGTVRLNGRPQRGLRVRFTPDREKGNGRPAFATGFTDDQGQYSLQYEFHNKEGAGAPVGWHRVVVEDTTRAPTASGVTPPPPLIPAEFSAPATTPLLKEVKPGAQTIDLDITNK